MERQEIHQTVYQHYEQGFHCAEAIAKTVLAGFSDAPHPEAVRIASGFGGGIAGSTRELCGAFTGGVIALSCLLGRAHPSESLKDFATVTKEFRKRFQEAFGELTCHSILERSNRQENPGGCIQLTAQAAAMVFDLLRDLEAQWPKDLRAGKIPHAMIGLGQCPFGGCAC